MGIFGRIGQTLGTGLRKFGELGGAAVNRIGDVKRAYDAANRATGGVIGHALESLPVVGPVLKAGGNFLKSQSNLAGVANAMGRARVYGADIHKLAS